MFKYIYRGKQKDIVLIPGWAADCRVFERLELGYNYFLPVEFSPGTFIKDLKQFLDKKNINKISLFGWSLGGFCAAGFAGSYPHQVDQLILAGIREKYSRQGIARIKSYLLRNKNAYLCRFYKQCFYQPQAWMEFKRNLLALYCEKFALGYLLETLAYLEQARINIERLNRVEKIKIIHGQYDKIAPIQEAKRIAKSLPQAEFVEVKAAGHGECVKC